MIRGIKREKNDIISSCIKDKQLNCVILSLKKVNI